MNKLISAFALAGVICISSAAWQSTGDAKAADPIPVPVMQLSLGSSADCPNFSSGTLQLSQSATLDIWSGCFVASFQTSFAASQLGFSTGDADNSLFSVSVSGTNYSAISATPINLNLPSMQSSAVISVRSKSLQTPSTYAGTITVTASGSMITEYTFSAISAVQNFAAPANGIYKLEVWGAAGGEWGDSTEAGYGGYSTGEYFLAAGQTIYVYVGGKGQDGNLVSTSAGGWNGGGNGAGTTNGSYTKAAGAGGGGTDIRLSSTASLTGVAATDPRIIVAGGGGSSRATGRVVYGGGVEGGSAAYSASSASGIGGTSSTGYLPGQGQDAIVSTNASHTGHRGSGGGWWGGSSLMTVSNTPGSGGGGSGFVSPALTNSYTTGGNLQMPNPAGGTMTGRAGNGYARITYCGTTC